MKRVRILLVSIIATIAALACLGLAGCGGAASSAAPMPDMSKVLVADQDEARAYLESTCKVVESEPGAALNSCYVYSSEECAEACPNMDRATAESAGDALDMPGEWALYNISSTNAMLRAFGITSDTSNEEIVKLLEDAYGVRMAMAYSQELEGSNGPDRTLWALTDGGIWFSIDSTGEYVVNFGVSNMQAGWMNETILAQRIADLQANPDPAFSDIYTVFKEDAEQES